MGDRLKGKVAVVTGAGSIDPGVGNGKATSVLYAREGAKVVLVDINPEAADETKSIIDGEGEECIGGKHCVLSPFPGFFQCDLTRINMLV